MLRPKLKETAQGTQTTEGKDIDGVLTVVFLKLWTVFPASSLNAKLTAISLLSFFLSTLGCLSFTVQDNV